MVRTRIALIAPVAIQMGDLRLINVLGTRHILFDE